MHADTAPMARDNIGHKLSIFGSYDLAIGSYDLESAISDLAIWAKYDLKNKSRFLCIFNKFCIHF